MVMSQGTYTFLTCFAGFWLIWGLIVLLCCFCSFLRRRLKRRQEERLREQNLRVLELDWVFTGPVAPTEEGAGWAWRWLRFLREAGDLAKVSAGGWRRVVSHLRTASHSTAESDMSKPPCYEEAVLMAEPPPPYSEVLTDTRGLYRKIVTPFLSRRDSAEKQEQPPPSRVFPSWTDSELNSREPLEPGAWRLPVSIPLFGRTTAV
ncbi:PREDICTED: proline-rich protein 7 [Myotis brandtii]|uniref:proline-rich protein 7 n=1 Tax=Myotis brandtii TaxID=109478 RepID=UPI000703DEF5|nr:PREDICTED: proline-rich protein 7 [Myotis brandtii]